nr:salicylate carboxymethyltransferase-like [Ipomoea batatas]
MTTVVVEVLGVNGGIGNTSYAKNSLPQQKAILKTKPITDQAITSLYTSNLNLNTISIADLGCSSGPNTFLTVSNLLKAVDRVRTKLRRDSPDFQIYLNDLPTNDFNSIFRSLPNHQEEFKREMGDGFGQCFFNGVPGSFYGRLFPADTLHFVHSSYSLQWLSQVPKGIEDNKANICMAPGSPPNVRKAFSAQFERDFLTFLKCRSKELVKDGRMVLTILGRKNEKPSFLIIELLGMALNELVSEGLVEEEKLNSFNVPMYTPSLAEVKSLVEKDGSFTINSLEAFQVHWTGNESDVENISDKNNGEYNVARCMRAVTEPTLVSHFGKGIIEDVFPKYRKMIADSMSREKTEFTNVTVSLVKT